MIVEISGLAMTAGSTPIFSAMIGSVLPESDEATVSADDVIVPSGTRNLAVDIGFQLRKDGVYPAVMDTIPTTDLSFGGKKK